jgi:hypothetical protein
MKRRLGSLLVTLFAFAASVPGAQDLPRKLETRFAITLYHDIDESGLLTEEEEGMLALERLAERYLEHRNNRYWFELVGRSQKAQLQLRLVRLTVYGEAAVIRAELTIGDFVKTISGSSDAGIEGAATVLIDNVRRFTERNFYKLRSGSGV